MSARLSEIATLAACLASAFLGCSQHQEMPRSVPDPSHPEVTVRPQASNGWDSGPAEPDGLADWCRHGGAPLVGEPLVDGRGRVYVVTGDGYLHAYEADGRYSYSYTVEGTPLGSPSLRRSDGAVLLGTSRSLIYAINQDGGLAFRFHSPSPVWSGLYAIDAQSVAFIGLDRHLYAISTRGSALYRVPIPGVPVAEPVVVDDGVVWIPLDTGLARIHRALKVIRAPLASPVERVAPMGDGALVLSGGEVFEIDQLGATTRLGVATFLGSSGRVAAWFDDGLAAALFLSGQTHQLKGRPETPASGHPWVGEDLVLLPLSSGSIAIWSGAGKSLAESPPQILKVAGSALGTPVVGPKPKVGHSRQIIVPTADGRVCSVTWEGP